MALVCLAAMISLTINSSCFFSYSFSRIFLSLIVLLFMTKTTIMTGRSITILISDYRVIRQNYCGIQSLQYLKHKLQNARKKQATAMIRKPLQRDSLYSEPCRLDDLIKVFLMQKQLIKMEIKQKSIIIPMQYPIQLFMFINSAASF